MTSEGPFQPKLFYDSMILWFYDSMNIKHVVLKALKLC